MRLDQITNGIIDLMNQNNYNQITIDSYIRVWNKINDFLLSEYQTDDYSADKGVKFLEKQYNLLTIYDHGTLSRKSDSIDQDCSFA